MIILFGLLCAGATDFGEGRNFWKREGFKRRDLYLLALLVFGERVGSIGSVQERSCNVGEGRGFTQQILREVS